MADLAADAAGLLEIAGWDTCRVLGVSFGGMVAQEFAVTHPERVERLALACTSAGGGGGSSYPLQKLRELPPEERAAAQLRLADSRWDERWLETRPADRALAERLTAAGQDQRDPAAAAAHQAQLEARAGHDVWDRLGAITCPTLVGYGNYDQIAPVQNGTASHRASAEPSCAATKEGTCSWSKTRPRYRNSRHSFKRRPANS
jgi:pimeloyl-ACP methyl ester carboxylesterase